MTNTAQLLLSSLVALILAAWRSGAIRLLSERVTPRLPKWAQPIPPFVIAVAGVVATLYSTGGAIDTEAAAGAPVVWLSAVGVYHVAKRWLPTIAKAPGKVGASIALLLVACGLSSGCAWWQSHSETVLDGAQTACEVALTQRPDVATAARTRGLTGQQWAAILCRAPDVLDAFLLEPDPRKAAEMALQSQTARSLTR